MTMSAAFSIGLSALIAGCGSGEQAEPDQLAEAPPPTRYTEIAPVVYMGAGNECALRLDDELDGALTTIVGGPGGRR